jgi:hypothetical protein
MIWVVVVVVVVVVVEVVVGGGGGGPTEEADIVVVASEATIDVAADIVVVVSEVTNDVACPSWVNVMVTVFVTHWPGPQVHGSFASAESSERFRGLIWLEDGTAGELDETVVAAAGIVAGEVTGSFDISVVIGLLGVKADAGMATALGPDSYGPVIVIAICVMLVDTLVIGRGVTVVHVLKVTVSVSDSVIKEVTVVPGRVVPGTVVSGRVTVSRTVDVMVLAVMVVVSVVITTHWSDPESSDGGSSAAKLCAAIAVDVAAVADTFQFVLGPGEYENGFEGARTRVPTILAF